MTSRERSKKEKLLDKLFSEYIRKRDGRCLRCGKRENLQCSHIASRRHKAGRWNEWNAIALCPACHLFWWHKEPVEAAKWLESCLPLHYNESLKVKNTVVKNQDIDGLISMYKEKLCENNDQKQ